MPPRKKARAQNTIMAAFNESSQANMGSVSNFQKDVALTVELMYSMRHGVAEGNKRPFDDMMGGVESPPNSGVPHPDEKGEYPWPLSHGGTFLDMVQRATSNVDWFLAESSQMLFAAGITESEDPCAFKQLFTTLDVAWHRDCINLWLKTLRTTLSKSSLPLS